MFPQVMFLFQGLHITNITLHDNGHEYLTLRVIKIMHSEYAKKAKIGSVHTVLWFIIREPMVHFL